MRGRRPIGVILAGLLAVPAAQLGAFAAAAPPNLVLIVADDLGARDLGGTGSDYHRTPHLDRLAAEGVRFTAAYANGPNCAPTRAALMSGMYAPRTGIYTVGSAKRGRAANRRLEPPRNRTTLAPGVETLAERLRAAGYATGFIGKWHLGDGAAGPEAQGFDVNVGGNKAGHPKSYFSPYRNPDLADGPAGEYLTTRLTDEAIAFVNGRAGRPFFLCLSYYTVHTPIQPEPHREAWYATQPRGRRHAHPAYAAMVDALDDQVGRLLGALDAGGLRDDTVVVFLSDNGGVMPITTQAPLRGAKGMLYEGGVRVPLIVRWPGHTPAGAACTVPVLSFDLHPTLLELAGAAPAPNADGRSLVDLLRAPDAGLDRSALFWHFPAYLEAGARLGIGPWRTTPAGALRAGRWKLIEWFETGAVELYDLAADPGETTNLATTQPERTARLRAELAAWRAETGAAMPVPRPAG